MLEMDGMGFIIALREKDPNINKEAVFVLLSSGLNPTEVNAFKELGVQEIVLKPLTSEAVMSVSVLNKYWKDKKATVADK